jgi:hypothetical protein
VDFYCGLARSDFGGNLLIQHSGDDFSHNLLPRECATESNQGPC